MSTDEERMEQEAAIAAQRALEGTDQCAAAAIERVLRSGQSICGGRFTVNRAIVWHGYDER